MTDYREFGSELIDQVYQIYEENQWSSYLGDREKLARAFDNSLYVLGAFVGDKLVGFVRCVGDGESVIYVQDLIVRQGYRRQGIGRELMKQASDRYPGVRQFLLITDSEDKDANDFYKAIGMTEEFYGYPVRHYFRSKQK